MAKTPVYQNLDLANEQKVAVLKCWNDRIEQKLDPPTLLELTQAAFPEVTSTRCPECVSVRRFLSEKSLEYEKKRKPKKEEVGLNEELRKQIIELKQLGDNDLTIAKKIFDNEDLKTLCNEHRTVTNYLKSLPPAVRERIAPVESKSYRPPKTHIEAIARVNRCILNCISKEDAEKENIKRCMHKLIEYLHSRRISNDCDHIKEVRDKELYEDTLIKYIWDKPDLSQEDIDSYCNVAIKSIDYTKLVREENQIVESIENNLADTEGQKINTSLYEQLEYIRKRKDQCIDDQEKIKKALAGSRADRNKGKLGKKATFLDMIQLVQDGSKRQNILSLMDKYKDEMKKEIGRLSSMDSLDFEISGVDPAELLN